MVNLMTGQVETLFDTLDDLDRKLKVSGLA